VCRGLVVSVMGELSVCRGLVVSVMAELSVCRGLVVSVMRKTRYEEINLSKCHFFLEICSGR
jgi:hypothetical protein